MEGLSQVFGGWTMSSPAALVMLLAFLTLFYLFAARARAGFVYSLRRIGGYEAIKKAVGEAAEMGKPLHMALGIEGIGSVKTLETLASVKILLMLSGCSPSSFSALATAWCRSSIVTAMRPVASRLAALSLSRIMSLKLSADSMSWAAM